MAALVGLLGPAACDASPDDQPPDSPATQADTAGPPALVGPVPREPEGELLDSAIVDLEGDGVLERVELRARVERDDRGRLMWDDGQAWTLAVVGEAGTWVLFDGWVQLGTLGFWLLEPAADAPLSILALEDAGAGVRIRRFDWRPEQRAFREVDVLEAHGNVLHRP